MKFRYIFLLIIIAAAFIGFQSYFNPSVAKTDEEHDHHGKQSISSETHDLTSHEIDGGHDMQHEEDTDSEAIHDDHDDHDHEPDTGSRDTDEDMHDDEDTHDAHAGHGHSEEAEEGFIDLMDAAQAKEAGITTDTIRTGTIERQIKLTGEVILNQDRIVHLVPRISGVVTTVYKKLGDAVKQGDVMAVIHSRELTDIKSDYLSSIERIANAKINFEREESLWKKKIIPERQYLESKQEYIETRIAMQAAERKLHALGFSEQAIIDLPNQSHESLVRYLLTAPGDGIIIEKHMVQGELVTTESPVFIIADTRSLWIDLQVYPKDLAAVKTGQKVLVSALDGTLTAEGTLSFLSPVLNRETRTALARVELPNTDSMWRAGLFATAMVTKESTGTTGTLIVPKSAVQTIDGKTSVFIVTSKGYFPKTVETGQSNNTHVEILSGVTAGQPYVRSGSYELKAKLVTSALDGHAGHGH